MLFNLQGAHRFQRRAFILPQLFSFVKHFFQVFSNSFALSFAGLSPCFAVLANSLTRLPHSVSFVKHFFQVFQNFFVLFSKPSVVFAVLSDSLSRISPFQSFVKHFFQVFQTDFQAPDWFDCSDSFLNRLCRRAFLCPAPEALAYNSKIPLTCQHLFSSFFDLFSRPPHLPFSSCFDHKICPFSGLRPPLFSRDREGRAARRPKRGSPPQGVLRPSRS